MTSPQRYGTETDPEDAVRETQYLNQSSSASKFLLKSKGCFVFKTLKMITNILRVIAKSAF
jgi:hypothetical protein